VLHQGGCEAKPNVFVVPELRLRVEMRSRHTQPLRRRPLHAEAIQMLFRVLLNWRWWKESR